MKLRYKMNLISTGWCALGAVILAICHQLALALLSLGLSYLNWVVALKGEE